MLSFSRDFLDLLRSVVGTDSLYMYQNLACIKSGDGELSANVLIRLLSYYCEAAEDCFTCL